MNKQKAIQTAYPRIAKERGTSVPVSNRLLKFSDGSSTKAVGIDLSQATCPDRSYHAELAGVAYENGIVKLLFGQATRSKKVRSLIEVSMSPHAVIQSLNVIAEIKNPSIEDLLRLTGEETRTLSEFDEDPPEVARLKANMWSVGFSGSEASIDFYDASPFAMGMLQNGAAASITIVGVVRIDTQTALVHALILRLRELISQFPCQIRDGMEAENGNI